MTDEEKEKFVGMAQELQDIVKALEGVEGLGGSQFTHGPFSPSELVRVLVAMLNEQGRELHAFKKGVRFGECMMCHQRIELDHRGFCPSCREKVT